MWLQERVSLLKISKWVFSIIICMYISCWLECITFQTRNEVLLVAVSEYLCMFRYVALNGLKVKGWWGKYTD
jgi:hypothetical protein